MLVLVLLLLLLPRPVDSPSLSLSPFRYIRLKTMLCVMVGAAVGLILWALGVALAWVFGFLAFVCNYVPNVGALVSVLLPLPIIVLDPGLSLWHKVLAFVLPCMCHIFVGYFGEPLIFGERLNIHPIVVLMSLSFWAMMWGAPGMILSVPFVSILRIACKQLDHPATRVVAGLLEGNVVDTAVSPAKKGR